MFNDVIVNRTDCKEFCESLPERAEIFMRDARNPKLGYRFRREDGKTLMGHGKAGDDFPLYVADANTVWQARRSINEWLRVHKRGAIA